MSAASSNRGVGPSRSGCLSAFFGLVPLHGLQIFAGLVWMAVIGTQVKTLGLVHQVKGRLLRLDLSRRTSLAVIGVLALL